MDNIKKNVSLETVINICNGLSRKEKGALTVKGFKVKDGSEKAHYCSVMSVLVINVENDHGESSELSVMLKTVPDNPVRIRFLQDAKFFTKEIDMYEKIIPDIMHPCGLGNTFAKLYHTLSDDEAGDYYIAMEDLTESGYRTFDDRVSGLDELHASAVISKLAQLHAASFTKYQGAGEKLQAKFPDIKEHFWKTDLEKGEIPEMNAGFIFNTMSQIIQMLKDKDMEHLIPRLESFMGNGHDVISKLAQVPRKFPAVVTHGDAWTTNFMFKYDQSGKIEDLKMVDFQMCRIASRMTDVAYFMYTSINDNLMNTNVDSSLRMYYDAFNTYCTQFGGTGFQLYYNGIELSWEYFLEEWNMYQKFGLVCALLYIPVMYTDPKNPLNLDKIEEKDVKINDDKSATGTFDNIWTFKPMQDKLLNIIINHLPEKRS